MRAIGLEFHNTHCRYVQMDDAGRVVSTGLLRATPEALRKKFQAMRPTCVAMSCLPKWRWVVDLLNGLHHAVHYSVIASPADTAHCDVDMLARAAEPLPSASEKRAVRSKTGNRRQLAHELYGPLFPAFNLEAIEAVVPASRAHCSAEDHARRMLRQWRLAAINNRMETAPAA